MRSVSLICFVLLSLNRSTVTASSQTPLQCVDLVKSFQTFVKTPTNDRPTIPSSASVCKDNAWTQFILREIDSTIPRTAFDFTTNAGILNLDADDTEREKQLRELIVLAILGKQVAYVSNDNAADRRFMFDTETQQFVEQLTQSKYSETFLYIMLVVLLLALVSILFVNMTSKNKVVPLPLEGPGVPQQKQAKLMSQMRISGPRTASRYSGYEAVAVVDM